MIQYLKQGDRIYRIDKSTSVITEIEFGFGYERIDHIVFKTIASCIIFPNVHAKPISEKTFNRYFRKACKQFKIKL